MIESIMQHKHGKMIAITGSVILLVVGVWLLRSLARDTPSEPASSMTAQPQSDKAKQSTVIRFIATGDMLPHDTVNQAARQSDDSYNYLPLFENVQHYMKADIAFCNQESPSAAALSVTGYPTFNAPVAFARDLQGVGCNVVNLANNHSNDRGQRGIDGTRDTWDGLSTLAVAGMARSAEEQQKISAFTVKNLRFAFLSYTICSNVPLANEYGVNMLTKSLADQQIKQAKTRADMIIVGTHWCKENTHQQDATQDMWAEYFAAQGVDIVVGTGPHWLQPVKRLAKAGGGETVVWFSLGNFLNSQLEKEGLLSGIAVMDIEPSNKTVTRLAFMPTYMHYEWTEQQRADQDLLARKNLGLYPLDLATNQLQHSLFATSVSVEQESIKQIMNTYTPVDMLTSTNFTQQ